MNQLKKHFEKIKMLLKIGISQPFRSPHIVDALERSKKKAGQSEHALTTVLKVCVNFCHRDICVCASLFF
jgi:hypothetical protein